MTEYEIELTVRVQASTQRSAEFAALYLEEVLERNPYSARVQRPRVMGSRVRAVEGDWDVGSEAMFWRHVARYGFGELVL